MICLLLLAALEACVADGRLCPLAPKTPAVQPVDLRAGELLQVRVEAQGVDLRLELRRPDGTEIVRADERMAGDGVEEIFWIAERTERVDLVVRPLAGAGGACRILPIEVRPATDAERIRAQAIAVGLALRWLYGKGTPDAARELVARAPAAAERLIAAGEPRRGLVALHQRARSLREDLRQLPEAREAFLEIAERARALGLADRRAEALLWLAIDASRLGRAGEAEPLAAEAVLEARRGGDTAVLADALGVHALRLDAVGRVAESEPLQREAIRLHETLGRLESVALARGNLGHQLFRRGRLEAARTEFEAAEATLARLGRSGPRVQAIGNLVGVLLVLGHYEEARDRLEAALALPTAGAPADYRIRAKVQLAGALRGLERSEDARALLQAAEREARTAGFPDLVGLALEDQGELALAAGRLDEAARPLAECVELWREGGDPERLSAGLVRQAELQRRQGAYEPAGRTLEEALELARKDGYQLREMDALFGRALLRRDRHELGRALEDVRAAIALAESVRDTLVAGADRAGYLGQIRDFYRLEAELLLGLEALNPGGGHLAAAFAAAERGRSRWLLELLDPARASRLDGEAGLVADAAVRLRAAQRRLLESNHRLESSERREMERAVEESARVLEAARRDLAAKRPKAGVLAAGEVGRAAASVGSALGPREALLEYVISDDEAWLFVARHDGLRAVRLGAPEEIKAAVADLLRLLERPRALGAAEFGRASQRVHAQILEPARAQLVGVTRLLISPDGALHGLPFAVLVEAAGGRSYAELAYLVRRVELARVPSAAAWLELERRGAVAGGGPPLVAFADPQDAGGAPARTRGLFELGAEGLAALPQARDEVAVIGGLFSGARSYVGAEASERRVKVDPEVVRSRRLHFATHGLPSERRPELSALLLSPSADDEDGLLQAWEIAQLSLDADLVVLSACRSAAGRAVSGEGFVGLTHAFFEAGVRSVVASLWEIDDRSTAGFMRLFYERLARGAEPSAALAAAQRRMIARGGLDAHPSRWAAFVGIGAVRSPVELPPNREP